MERLRDYEDVTPDGDYDGFRDIYITAEVGTVTVLVGENGSLTEVPTEILRAGDTVLVKAEKDNRLLASFIVYIVPVLLAAAGLLIGFFCFEEELYIALLCLSGLILGLTCVFFCDRALSKTRGFGMEVVEIIETERGSASPQGGEPSADDTNKQEETEWRIK